MAQKVIVDTIASPHFVWTPRLCIYFTSASVFRGLTVVVVFVVIVVIVVVFEQIADSNFLVLMETPL